MRNQQAGDDRKFESWSLAPEIIRIAQTLRELRG